MSDLPPIGAEYPAFLAVFHLPGIDLADPIMKVAGIWIRRISWIDWTTIENSDDAFRLHGNFAAARHVFCSVNLSDFKGSNQEAKQIQVVCQDNILRLISALRLHKAGAVVDPRYSKTYLRLLSLNIRAPGPYGARLLEYPPEPRYLIEQSDLDDIALLHGHLHHLETATDPGVQLALRSFCFSYGYGLSTTQRLAFLFTALEAVFGEYSKHNRPAPKVTLGEAAATVSSEPDKVAATAFLDGSDAARGLRNCIAHGSLGGPLEVHDPAILRLENIVRDGLRALITFTTKRQSLLPQLNNIEVGLGASPPKVAFQKLLGHSAKGLPDAIKIVASLIGPAT